MTIYKLHILSSVLLVFSFSGAKCQDQLNDRDQFFDEVSVELESMVKEHIPSDLFFDYNQDVSFVNDIFLPELSDSSSIEMFDANVEAELNHLYKDFGLRLNSGYLENLKGSIVEDEGFFYNRRFKVGLSWDVLKSGLFDNNFEAKQKSKEFAALRIEEHSRLKEKTYRYAFNEIIYLFNLKKIQVLKNRRELIDRRLDIAYKIYFLKYIHWEDVMEILDEKAEASLLIENYQEYVKKVELPDGRKYGLPKLPVLEIDINKLSTNGLEFYDRAEALNMRLEALKYKYSPVRDISLNTFVRYSVYYDNTSVNDRDFVSFGMTLGVPLPLRINTNKALIDAKASHLEGKVQEYYNNTYNEMLNHYYEYQYSLKQYIQFFYKRKYREVLIEREMNKRLMNDPDFSPVHVLSLINEMLNIDLELLDIHQKMYLKLLKLFNLGDYDQVTDFTYVEDFSNIFDKYTINRSMYMWSSALQDNTNDYISKVIDHNGFNELILSVGDYKANKERLESLKALCAEKGISITYMVGENRILKNDDVRQRWLKFIREQKIEHIHFDIEPHAMDEWDTDKIALQNKLISFLEDVRAIDPHMQIDISIPLHYDEDFLNQLYSLSDKVYVMAYETTNVESIKRRSQEEFGISQDKTIIAIRCKDFENRYAMEYHINKLKELLGLDDIAVHDFKTFMELEERTIQIK